LLGKYNPAGKLPMSFPRSVGQIPVFYNERSTGRPFDPNSKWTSKYIDEANSPQWPFGFGLSYTTFDYSEIQAESLDFSLKKPLKLRIEVKNSGKMAGEEVVQLYVRDLVASVTRPVKELKGFQKIMLQPGESRMLEFTLEEKDVRFYRKDMTFGSETGEYDIMIGGSSDATRKIRVRLN